LKLKNVNATTQHGEQLTLGLDEIVSRVSWLTAARVIPPMNLVNELLQGGSARFDHWRQLNWEPIVIDRDEYSALVAGLANRGFSESPRSSNDVSRIEWSAIQLSATTGRDTAEVMPLLRRLDLLERLLDVAGESDQNDIIEFLTLEKAKIVQEL
jgi:hypothetical protein